MTVTVTAYCPCPICCGKSDGITCSGVRARANRTIAVDPDVIPLGSEVYLEGLGIFIAEDTGGAIKGNRIDIFMEDHQQALLFGIKEMKAYILQKESEIHETLL
ncbi:MAG: hypothetical protein PWP44_620 [Thermacetogenium sp.]|uniref:3D domain-containing protein n=1 Tax=Thermacetogenium phaeum TaxID=85874 RepID=A0A101FGD8_9THEO|nr:MAG: Uncharacterized protein XD66_0808 [Thermacetogenium phaeum]MDN5365417.1 hypothetical protein [Thermacetogenium sp.]